MAMAVRGNGVRSSESGPSSGVALLTYVKLLSSSKSSMVSCHFSRHSYLATWLLPPMYHVVFLHVLHWSFFDCVVTMRHHCCLSSQKKHFRPKHHETSPPVLSATTQPGSLLFQTAGPGLHSALQKPTPSTHEYSHYYSQQQNTPQTHAEVLVEY